MFIALLPGGENYKAGAKYQAGAVYVSSQDI